MVCAYIRRLLIHGPVLLHITTLTMVVTVSAELLTQIASTKIIQPIGIALMVKSASMINVLLANCRRLLTHGPVLLIITTVTMVVTVSAELLIQIALSQIRPFGIAPLFKPASMISVLIHKDAQEHTVF